jgi:hypothetical protein
MSTRVHIRMTEKWITIFHQLHAWKRTARVSIKIADRRVPTPVTRHRAALVI